jgi:hypothetical protein
VRFSGFVEIFGHVNLIGVTTVTCPEFGEHEFTYLIGVFK